MPTTYFATLTSENNGNFRIVYRKKLWTSDGVTAREVFDFGTSDSIVNDIHLLSAYGHGVVFTPSQGSTRGDDLWFSDGTAGGTVQLTRDNNGLSTLRPSDPTTFNGKLYFGAHSTAGPLALWQSNGTAAGTTLVKNIYTNSGITSISEFTEVNGKLYFIANYQGADILGNPNGIYVGELWKTDGTNAGTTKVATLGTNDAVRSHIGALGNRLLFWVTGSALTTDKKLEITDGTSITVLADFPHGSQNSDFGELSGKAFFSINDGTHGAALWKTDGTVSGTMLVNANVVGAANFTVSNGHLYFTANGGSGVELFSTDGNTLTAYDIKAGSASSNPGNLTDVNGSLYFSADDGNDGTELWKVNPSGAASIVRDIKSGSGSSSPLNLINGGSVLFFEANDGTGYGLFRSDGTAAGMVELAAGVDFSADIAFNPGGISSVALSDFGWAQGWGSPNNPRMTADVDGNGSVDYLGFGFQSVFVAYGGTFSDRQGHLGHGFTAATGVVNDFGTSEGYTAVVQRGAASTGAGPGASFYGQGFAGVYWYAATGATPQTDAAGHTYNVLTYQTSPNFYGNFGSQQGWTPDNGFQVLKASTGDPFASILGFGNDGIVVGPQAFAPGATAANSYLIPLAAGNNSGWRQSVDIRSFTDAAGKVIDLNGDGIADFVGMGPQGLVFALGNHTGPGGGFGLGALQTAHVGAGGAADLGEAQGWNNAATLRYIVKDPLTGRDDILAFGAPGVFVTMGQDPATHGGEPFGQLYLAMADFGSNQGWSVDQTPRIVGDVNGDGIPDIVGFGFNSTFAAIGSRDAGGNLHFALDPSQTIGDFGIAEGWSGSNPQTIRALADVAGTGHADLILSGAFNTQVWQFG